MKGEMDEVSPEVPAPVTFKWLEKTLLFFFRLAWLSRIRLPAYLTFLLLAADLRLSVEIMVGDENAAFHEEDEDGD